MFGILTDFHTLHNNMITAFSFSNLFSMQIFHSAYIDTRNGEFHIPINGEFMPYNSFAIQIMPSEILVSIDICPLSSVVVNFLTF